MNFYTVYELNICTDLDIPELQPKIEGDSATVDLHIVAGDISLEHQQALPQVGPFLSADEKSIFLTIPNIAKFLIESGQRITYERLADCSDDDIRAYLLGSCLGAILMQRGLFLLHGCAIQVGAGAVVCVGQSTFGKSTLAAAFMQSGHAIASDDVCAFTPQGHVIPGVPRIKLNQDVADKLSIDTSGLKTIRAACDGKFSLPLDTAYCSEKLPLLAIYELLPDKGEVTIFHDLSRLERFAAVRRNIYRPRYSKAMSQSVVYFQRCNDLVASTHISQIHRTHHDFTADELKTLILEDLSRQQLI